MDGNSNRVFFYYKLWEFHQTKWMIANGDIVVVKMNG